MSNYNSNINNGYVQVPDREPQRYINDESFIMLIRDIQYNDIMNGSFNIFPTLYDIAKANGGRKYIYVKNNDELIQDPSIINMHKKYY